MNDETKKLATRLVGLEQFEWRPGMRAVHESIDGARVVCSEGGDWTESNIIGPCADGNAILSIDSGLILALMDAKLPIPILPDLDDPATIGALLGLARDLWGSEKFHVWPGSLNDKWSWSGPNEQCPRYLQSQAAALVNLIECAPCSP